jgi:drug/metabolite transporter (DMT)-like permease
MGYFYAVIAAVIWWLAYALDQRILEHISTPILVFINALFTVLVLLPFILTHGDEVKSLATLDKTTLTFLGASLLATLLAGFLILIAIGAIGAPKAAIFEIAYPFFVVIFSIFLYQSHVNNYFILGSIFLFIGSFIIITKG